jgi:predicted 2-oxoglutarate/Fe(II)-dependent dioxygenase YbiX
MWAVGVLAAGLITFVGVGGLGAAARTSQDQISASVSGIVERDVQQSTAQEQAKAPDNDPTKAEARAEIARKWSIIAAFISAASLLVGAVAAFYGAHSGGHHRDRNVRWELFSSRVRGVYVAPVDAKPPGGP